jgi:hypothetical protein
MTRPMTVRVASILLAGSGLLLGVWAVATFWKFGQFSAAAHKIFDADPDADMSVGSLQVGFLTGAVLSMIVACTLLVLARGVYRSLNRARMLSRIVSLAALPFLWLTYIRNGTSYITAINTGPGDTVARAEMAKVNELTPWRFSGWYHSITLGFGIAVAIFLVVGVALLRSPSSNRYFRNSSQ